MDKKNKKKKAGNRTRMITEGKREAKAMKKETWKEEDYGENHEKRAKQENRRRVLRRKL